MKLTSLKKRNINLITTMQAKRFGITPQLLAHYLKRGLVERTSHGVYRLSNTRDFDLDSILHETLKAIPRGIVGFKTAIRMYGLSDESHQDIDIIVSSTNVPKRKIEDVVLRATKNNLYQIDVKKIRGIPVTSFERTLVDLLRTGCSLAQILEIYREAKIKGIPFSFTKFKKLGGLFRAKQKVSLFVEMIL